MEQMAAALSAVRFLHSIALDSYAALEEQRLLVPVAHIPVTAGCELDRARFEGCAGSARRQSNASELLEVRVFRRVRAYAKEDGGTSRRTAAVDATPSVLVLHGFCPSGVEDERVVQLARSLASSGFIALMPRLPPLERCYIGRACIDSIVRAALALLARRDLCPSGKLSFSAACISAGMALIAAAQPMLRASTSAFLLIGAYARVENVVQYTMNADCDDNYGRNAMFLNFGRVVWNADSNSAFVLERMLLASLHVNHYTTQSKPQLLAHARATLEELMSSHEREAAMLLALDSEPDFRKTTADCILDALRCETSSPSYLKPMDRGILDALNAEKAIPQLGDGVSICMMHGENDCVVSASESYILLHAAREAKRNAVLSVTPLIDHGTKDSFSPGAILSIVHLFKVVYTFALRAQRTR